MYLGFESPPLIQKNEALKSRSEDYQMSMMGVAFEELAVLRALEQIKTKDLLPLSKALQKPSLDQADELERLQHRLVPMALQLQDLGARSHEYLRLYVSRLPIDQWWQDVKVTAKKKGIAGPIYLKKYTTHQQVICDPVRITELLTKAILLVDDAHKRSTSTDLFLDLYSELEGSERKAEMAL